MRFRPALLISLVACATPAPTPPPVVTAAPKEEKKPLPPPPTLRLPDTVTPKAVQLSLRIVPGEETVSGEIVIAARVEKATDVIWLNGNGITPGAATLGLGDTKSSAHAEVAGKQFLALTTGQTIPAGPIEIDLQFTAPLSRKNNAGLFQLQEGGDSYAYTHFEPIDARRAFPCFDEPQFKIPWQVTLHVKKEHVALSNTPMVLEKDEPNGMKEVTFAPTPPLPSYLIAMAVGAFDVVDAGKWGKNKTPVRIVAPKGQGPQLKYAVENTGPILEELEKYFGSAYPFEKLDQISLPVGIGAMENPGLVTYGHLLINAKPEEDTPGRQRSYASVCAHELAHMWFGDLVTMAWWDDIWLNEAFATWMSGKVIETWKPKWDADVGRVGRRAGALGADSLINSRRIRQPIVTEDDIKNAFDGITYGKGATVLSMFESYVGEEKFRDGVRAYLSQHARGNATATDFLAAESKVFGQDLSPAFNTFLDQSGAPAVTFAVHCDNKPATLTFTQKRYLPLGSKGDAKQLWKVPMCIRTNDGRVCTLLDSEQGTVELKSCPKWLLANDGMRGYYRSRVPGYDGATLLKAAGDKLSIAERVGVLSDLNAMINAGDASVADALATVPLALAANNRHLTNQALGEASFASDDVVPEPQHAKYQQWVREMFGPLAKKLSFTVGSSDDEDTRLTRPGVLFFVAREGVDPALRTQSVELAQKWLKDHKAVHPDMVEIALAIGADTNDVALHDALLNGARVAPERLDKLRMLSALSSFRAPDVVSAQLPIALGKDFETRDAMRLVWGAAGSSKTRELAIDFVEKNFDGLVERLPAEAGADLIGVAGGTCDEAHRDAVRAFFDGRSTKYIGGPRNFAMTMEGIELCIAWRAKHRPEAVAFFDAWKPHLTK